MTSLFSAGQQSGFEALLEEDSGAFTLSDGARIGVVGGGPAGTFFSYFVQRMAASIGLELEVDIYEPRLFTQCGPAGCNHCGGVVSESLVQLLATEGIVLPSEVVQRGIEAYVLHMDVGDVRIEAASHESRIASVFRGNGPRRSSPVEVAGFDAFMLDLCRGTGASVQRKVVNGIEWHEGRPQVVTVDGSRRGYDLVAVASGVNSQALRMLSDASVVYEPPSTRKAFICEFDLGEEGVRACLGSAMHVFLLDVARLDFAAMIPKGRFVTLCMIGQDIDDDLVAQFLATDEVKACFPGHVVPQPACHCFPRINVHAADRPFADRVVWIGDSGACKLYKDGIGSAYRTAKAAATTSVFHGVGAADFERRFRHECDSLARDNKIAAFIFAVTRVIQRMRFLRHGVLRMVAREQARVPARRHMSRMLWDVFTGSAPYSEVMQRSFHPEFGVQLVWNVLAGNCARALPERGGG